MKNQEIVAFENKSIRRIEQNGEWFFSVIDVIQILTESKKPSQYWHNMKKRDAQLSPICLKLKLVGIDIRKQLTDEWQQRGVKEGQEYAILTAEIAKATFGLTPSEHAQFKGLEKQNLRDHMTNFELIFTMLGEESTRRYAQKDDAKGFHDNYNSAQKGGRAAGNALSSYEATTSEEVLSADNFLHLVASPKSAESLTTKGDDAIIESKKAE